MIDGSTRQEALQRAELAQLRRLRQLREDAARAVRETRAAERDAALAAVQAREARIAQLRRDIVRLAEFVAGDGAHWMPQMAPYAAARRALFDDQLERAVYGLIDDQETLAEAEQALARAQAALLRAGLHSQVVARLQLDARRDHAQAGERRLEREAEPRPMRLPGASA